jgi:4-oxalocrotonate tautomerase
VPIQRIAMRKGKSPEYRRAIAEGVQTALATCFEVPGTDLYAIIDEYDDSNLLVPRSYKHYLRTDDAVLIFIFGSTGRSAEKKATLFESISHNLERNPGLRRDDVVINIVDTPDENWSVAGGEQLGSLPIAAH